MFKRPVWSSSTGEASQKNGRFFCGDGVDIYIYSDESGVFDYKHRKYFVIAGIIFTDKMDMDLMIRRYKSAENNLRKKKLYKGISELKASKLSFDDRRNLFRLTSGADRFAFIINMYSLDKKKVFENSKSKQMHLDWVFKVGLKKVILQLIEKGSISPSDVLNIRCYIDEHSTATKGRYDLAEAPTSFERENIIKAISTAINPKINCTSFFFDVAEKLENLGFVFSFIGIDGCVNGVERYKIYFRSYEDKNWEIIEKEITELLSHLRLNDRVQTIFNNHKNGMWGIALSTDFFENINRVQLYFNP